jgi:hypothetical protein
MKTTLAHLTAITSALTIPVGAGAPRGSGCSLDWFAIEENEEHLAMRPSQVFAFTLALFACVVSIARAAELPPQLQRH